MTHSINEGRPARLVSVVTPQRIHLLTQYVWPDWAPTGALAEQLADRLTAAGHHVTLVAGSGTYREGKRPAPVTPIVRLEHFRGKRGRLGSTAREYWAVNRAFASYIRSQVQPGDRVIVTSAPPNSIRLIHPIHKVGATGIYWLQDYYPELFRTIIDPPRPIRFLFARAWDRWLRQWNHVIKVAGNLGYSADNARVIRNWPTLRSKGSYKQKRNGANPSALYTGNLGYCHDIDCFIRECEKLRAQGYEISVRGDGPGIAKLPPWILAGPSFGSEGELADALESADVHLVAGHPKYQLAVFPSKFWNSFLTGKPIFYSGFEGAMLEELNVIRKMPIDIHLENWVTFIDEQNQPPSVQSTT